MIGSLVRWFDCGTSNKQPPCQSRSSLCFIPRLEALDGRVLPGGAAGGIVMSTGNLTVSQVSGDTGTTGRGEYLCAKHIGEEIPSVMHIGEEIPQTKRTSYDASSFNTVGIWIDANPKNDSQMRVFGGRGGLGGEV